MEPNNLPSNPPFFVGQKVVALKGGKEIKKGQVYVVQSIKKLCSCGWFVGVINIPDSHRPRYTCKKCGTVNENPKMRFFGGKHYLFTPYNPPRHQNVEIAEDILQMEVVEERCDVLPEKILNKG